VDVYLQAKRDGAVAKRFLKRLLRSHGSQLRKIVTDKLRSYGVAHRELIPEAIHSTQQYENNRAEQSYEATRARERGMCGPALRKFKSVRQAQRFLRAHAAVQNLFNIWAGTWLALNMTVILGLVRLASGVGQLLEPTQGVFLISRS
jgi:putative transposase